LRTEGRCKALVLAGTNGGVVDEAVRERQRAASAARNGRGLGAFSVHDSFREREPGLDFLLRSISRLNPPRPRDFLAPRIPASAVRGSTQERLIASGIPVLFIVGEHDQITPPDLIEMCHRLVPGSQFRVVPESGHSAYWEKPTIFNEAVLDFLREVEPSNRRESTRAETGPHSG
jgi:pimeloyl-ACP methyl ester carboxylesterase